MKVDLYTKAVLTVIALALVWIGIGGPQLLTVHAQGGQHVYVAGWIKYDGGRFVETRFDDVGLPVDTK